MAGQWLDSDRRERLPSDWPARRQRVLKRDGHRCTWKLRSGKRCPRDATEVDHRNAGDNHELENLQALCAHHHAQKTAREGNTGKRRSQKARQSEAHPSSRVDWSRPSTASDRGR